MRRVHHLRQKRGVELTTAKVAAIFGLRDAGCGLQQEMCVADSRWKAHGCTSSVSHTASCIPRPTTRSVKLTQWRACLQATPHKGRIDSSARIESTRGYVVNVCNANRVCINRLCASRGREIA